MPRIFCIDFRVIVDRNRTHRRRRIRLHSLAAYRRHSTYRIATASDFVFSFIPKIVYRRRWRRMLLSLRTHTMEHWSMAVNDKSLANATRDWRQNSWQRIIPFWPWRMLQYYNTLDITHQFNIQFVRTTKHVITNSCSLVHTNQPTPVCHTEKCVHELFDSHWYGRFEFGLFPSTAAPLTPLNYCNAAHSEGGWGYITNHGHQSTAIFRCS